MEEITEFYRVKDIAVMMGVSKSFIRTLWETGQLPPPMRLGSTLLWPKSLIDNWRIKREREYLKSLESDGFDVAASLQALSEFDDERGGS